MERPSRVFADTCDIGQRQNYAANYAAKRRRPQNADQKRRGWTYNPDRTRIPEVSTTPQAQEQAVAVINTLVKIYAVIELVVYHAVVNATTVITEVLPKVVWYAVGHILQYGPQVIWYAVEQVFQYCPQIVWYVGYYAIKVSYAILELVLDYAINIRFQLAYYAVQEQVVNKTTPVVPEQIMPPEPEPEQVVNTQQVVKIMPPDNVSEQVVKSTPPKVVQVQVVKTTLSEQTMPEQKPKTPKVTSNKVNKTNIFAVNKLKKTNIFEVNNIKKTDIFTKKNLKKEGQKKTRQTRYVWQNLSQPISTKLQFRQNFIRFKFLSFRPKRRRKLKRAHFRQKPRSNKRHFRPKHFRPKSFRPNSSSMEQSLRPNTAILTSLQFWQNFKSRYKSLFSFQPNQTISINSTKLNGHFFDQFRQKLNAIEQFSIKFIDSFFLNLKIDLF